ncbi:hypothetical protein ABZ035_33600, partial [Streptomyces sp. NPDC006334]
IFRQERSGIRGVESHLLHRRTSCTSPATGALATPAHDTVAAVAELRDRADIIDALYRFGPGQDLKDKELSVGFASTTPGTSANRP